MIYVYELSSAFGLINYYCHHCHHDHYLIVDQRHQAYDKMASRIKEQPPELCITCFKITEYFISQWRRLAKQWMCMVFVNI